MLRSSVKLHGSDIAQTAGRFPFCGTPVEPKKTPEEGYNLVEDMTDKALAWIGQKGLAPDKPFFVYAPGATHAPHHPPKEWADKHVV